jgi:ribosomal protein S18 acetylase RimI-like enzyme
LLLSIEADRPRSPSAAALAQAPDRDRRGGIWKYRGVEYREVTANDAEAIAELHAESWRRHYRGAYLDSFLDGDVVADRMAEWTGRLSPPAPDRYTVVADLDGAVVGFAHTILDADPTWGAYLDNLHVRHDLKRHGIGARLMAETVRAVARRRPSTGLYLWVLEQNTAAQAFYGAQGGRCVQRELAGPFPGGGYAFSFRYAWPDLSKLAEHH